MQLFRTFFMESLLEDNRFTAKYNLGESGGRPRTAGEVLLQSELARTDIVEKFLSTKLNDSPNWGRLDLREIVARFHPGAQVDNILITTGTSEALFLLFRVLKPKSVALALPGFQLLYEIPQALSAQIIPLPVYWDSDGKPFIDQTEWYDILNEKKPECILINNPHNPSGLILDESFLIILKNLVKNWDGNVIGDEHYRFLASEEDTLGHTIYENDSNIFVTGSFIKCLGVPGLRIGWCIGNHKILSRMQNEKNYTTHTVSPITEWISYEILKNIQSPLFLQMKQEWILNRQLCANFLKSSQSIYGVPPQGGLVTSLGFKQARSIEDTILSIELLRKKGIFVLPLSAMEFGNFDFQKITSFKNRSLSNINHGFGFRLGLGIDPDKLSEAFLSFS